jgi:phenylalanyl-tRNA synthetase beta chain
MQTPLKWINELVNLELINLDNLIEKLTLGGFEVEEILELEIENEKQLSLDISATANRSDSLSIQGISTEIATLLDQPTKISSYSLQTFDWKEQFNNFSLSISNQYNCLTLISVIVENLNDFTVPKWLKQKLLSSSIIPTNSFIDFQNYVLLETGYAFGFYDFQKICSKLNCSNFNLSMSKAENDQEFTATNEITYKLNSSITILQASSDSLDDLPISIAGIIENKDFDYSDSTTSLLIEASIFNAAAIRQQSRSLGLRTDRSARYEKSLKNTYLIESLYRLLSLLRISNPKMICKLHTFAQAIEKLPQPIVLKYQTVNEILGPIKGLNRRLNRRLRKPEDYTCYITPETITKYLNRLNFKFSYDDSTHSWEVQIPQSRSDDITREIDLIEEIGRLYGFNSFLTTLPKIKNIGNEDLSYKTRKKITSSLLNLGFNELIHYSLVNETTFTKNEIKLINPLLSDCSNLRSSLLPNLIKTVQENLKQGNSFIEGFEYGHVFSGLGLESPAPAQEKEYIAGIFGGIKTQLTWSESKKSLTWFEAKGKIEQFLKQLNLVLYWKNSTSTMDTIMHPYRNAELYFTNGVKLGIFGQIHPIVSNQLAISSEIYLFEFDLELIQSQLQANKLAISKEYSLYPKIIKDLSFIINQDIEFEKLKETLYCNGTKFLSEINLLDEYRGSSIPDGSTSLCFQLVFQSKEKTLENKEIENIIKSLQSVLVNQFDALIRN